MMKVRTRDFIHTKDDLFFACTNYAHPTDRIISFLRYIPDENGDREKNGRRYSKVDSQQAYDYLGQNHSEYLYFCDVTNIQMMGVPLDKVSNIICPNKRLKDIINKFSKNTHVLDSSNSSNSCFKNIDLIKKLIKVARFFNQIADISYDNLGISGSILPGLEKEEVSDIDFVVYGLENHRKAVEAFKNYKGKELPIMMDYISEEGESINGSDMATIKLEAIQDSFWNRLYEKRLKDSSLSKSEFAWYENRKNNRGVIEGTLFDILATRNWDEINDTWGSNTYEKLGVVTIEAKVKSALKSFDNPASYDIENLKIINCEGFSDDIDCFNLPIKTVVSFTHTYSGQVLDGEDIIAKGKVERVITNTASNDNNTCNNSNNNANNNSDTDGANNKNTSYRLVIGTTRESINEFIKLKNIPI
ncbi:MAG: DNA polymerase subunit beta [Methanobacteriaceae archaeon]